MNRDTVTGLVAAGVLVAAMVGVFFYERNVAIASGIGQNATGTGPLANLTLDALEGTTELGATTEEVVTVNQTGVTNVTFTLRWTAQNGADTLRLLVAPGAQTGLTDGGQGESDTGEIVVTIPVPNTAAEGATGVGPWQVTVEFVSASTGTPLPPGVAPGTSDTSVAWTLETTLQTLGG